MVKNNLQKSSFSRKAFFLFSNPFNMENLIKVNRPIFCAAREFYLNKGVKLKTDLICEPMLLFLIESLEKDSYCLVGDIGSLHRTKKKFKLAKQKAKYKLGKLLFSPNK